MVSFSLYEFIFVLFCLFMFHFKQELINSLAQHRLWMRVVGFMSVQFCIKHFKFFGNDDDDDDDDVVCNMIRSKMICSQNS